MRVWFGLHGIVKIRTVGTENHIDNTSDEQSNSRLNGESELL